jgi:hypothetical protein
MQTLNLARYPWTKPMPERAPILKRLVRSTRLYVASSVSADVAAANGREQKAANAGGVWAPDNPPSDPAAVDDEILRRAHSGIV